jgi:hypothetical protein
MGDLHACRGARIGSSELHQDEYLTDCVGPEWESGLWLSHLAPGVRDRLSPQERLSAKVCNLLAATACLLQGSRPFQFHGDLVQVQLVSSCA